MSSTPLSAAALWETIPAVVNVIALVVFAAALCWRIDQIRRHGGGLQAAAMTISIAALTLAFVTSNASVATTMDSAVYAGLSRMAFYALLAVGVAALIVVFFFPGKSTSRERRAGVEAVPLVVALIGLQVSLFFIPSNMRTASVSEWTLTNWGFALFYLIASAYLAYGFVACVRSVRKYLAHAAGYLRVALILLAAGLAMLAAGSVIQIVYVLGNATGVINVPWLLTTSRVLSVIGVVGFLLGICYPMVNARWRAITSRRRRARDAKALLPLWMLLTDAIPEVVLPTSGPVSATGLLHRRVIEIRDALTQLSPYLSPAFGYANAEVQVGMLTLAVAQRKRHGSRSGDVRRLLPATGEGLEGDAAPLLELSAALAASGVAEPGGLELADFDDDSTTESSAAGIADASAAASTDEPDELSAPEDQSQTSSAGSRRGTQSDPGRW